MASASHVQHSLSGFTRFLTEAQTQTFHFALRPMFNEGRGIVVLLHVMPKKHLCGLTLIVAWDFCTCIVSKPVQAHATMAAALRSPAPGNIQAGAARGGSHGVEMSRWPHLFQKTGATPVLAGNKSPIAEFPQFNVPPSSVCRTSILRATCLLGGSVREARHEQLCIPCCHTSIPCDGGAGQRWAAQFMFA